MLTCGLNRQYTMIEKLFHMNCGSKLSIDQYIPGHSLQKHSRIYFNLKGPMVFLELLTHDIAKHGDLTSTVACSLIELESCFISPGN